MEEIEDHIPSDVDMLFGDDGEAEDAGQAEGHDAWFRAQIEEALVSKAAGAEYVPLAQIASELLGDDSNP